MLSERQTASELKRDLIKTSLKSTAPAKQRAKSITKIMVETGDFKAQIDRVNYLQNLQNQRIEGK